MKQQKEEDHPRDEIGRFTGDGSTAKFVEGSKLQNKEIFAGAGCRRKIDDIDRLVRDYPGTSESEWMKAKAIAEIVTEYGEYMKAEIHWYEEPLVGKVEFKFKSEVQYEGYSQ